MTWRLAVVIVLVAILIYRILWLGHRQGDSRLTDALTYLACLAWGFVLGQALS